MTNEHFEGSVYLAEPADIQLNIEMVELNSEKPAAEYEALMISMRDLGQQRPVYMYRGLLVDGRHRRKIALELGVRLECIKIKDNAPMKTIIELCNMNEFSGRSLSGAQKAIRVLEMVGAYGYTQTEAMSKLGTCSKSDITAAKFIRDNSVYKNLYLGKLKNKESVKIDLRVLGIDRCYVGTSLRKIKEHLQAIEEVQLVPNEPEVKAVITVDYNTMINTAKGRVEFWEFTDRNPNMSYDDKLQLINYINTKWCKTTWANDMTPEIMGKLIGQLSSTNKNNMI